MSFVDRELRRGRLTPPQERMLEDVRKHGRMFYNGRARRTITALRKAGLVEAELEFFPRFGGGAQYVEHWTVWPRRGGQ